MFIVTWELADCCCVCAQASSTDTSHQWREWSCQIFLWKNPIILPIATVDVQMFALYNKYLHCLAFKGLYTKHCSSGIIAMF